MDIREGDGIKFRKGDAVIIKLRDLLIKKDPLPFLNEKGSIEYWPKVQSIIKTVADDRDPRTLVDLNQPIYALEGDVLKIICNNN